MEKVTARWQGALMSNEDLKHADVEHEGVEHANDEQQILALHEAGDKALMSADLAVLAQIFADDYMQYNESGKAFTKQDVLNNFRTGAIRYPSIVSTGRKIRVFGATAVVHGSESDLVEAGGKKFSVRYVYLDVLRKTNGEWKLVASQLARPVEMI
jgi:ketosteroid isomerase-like protein